MQNRNERFQEKTINPAKYFLNWSSNEKCFKYYDKESKTDVLIELPLKFIILSEFHTIKGWHDASESGIYSNEVYELSKEELIVKSFKGGVLCKGKYAEIKNLVHDNGGYYCASIYIKMIDLNEIWNLSLKGASVSEWYEFKKAMRNRLKDEFVCITGVLENKKGAVKYSTPIFKIDGSLDAINSTQTYEQDAILCQYYNQYKKENEIKKEEKIVLDTVVEDDLPF